MFKVLYVVNESSIGGAAQSLFEMLKSLHDYIEPIVIIPGSGMVEERLKEMNVKHLVIPFSTGFGIIGEHDINDENNNFADNFAAAMQVASVVELENIQIIHSNSSVSNVGAMSSIITGRPHVWHVREFMEEDFNCEYWDKTLKRMLFEQAKIITISNCVKEVFEKKYTFNTERIYNGIDIKKYKKDVTTKEVKMNSFLLAGVISQGKGQMDAIKAVEQIIRIGKNDISLKIVGSGNRRYIWLLKKYIQRHCLTKYIHMFPYRNDLTDLRDEHQFSITSSKMEALGRVTIEAMLAGNIVIGTNTGGTLELIGENQERGYLYQQGDYLDLARVMLQAMQENNSKIHRLKRAQEFAENNFALNSYARSILKVYNEVVKSKFVNKNQKKILNELKARYNRLDIEKKETNKGHKNLEKFKNLYSNTEKWLRIKLNGQTLISFLLKENIKNIAIYGMGSLGCNLYDELENSVIEVKYVIDRNIQNIEPVIKAVKPEDRLEKVDAIIVTIIGEELSIKESLSCKGNFRIWGITEILSEFEY